MQIDYPIRINNRNRIAGTTEKDHIRDMIEQVLFTSPGERVNRPTFGSGLLGLLFEPGGPVLAGMTEAVVSGALQQWLGELIQIDAVSVEQEDSTLRVDLVYTIRRTNERRRERFLRRETV